MLEKDCLKQHSKLEALQAGHAKLAARGCFIKPLLLVHSAAAGPNTTGRKRLRSHSATTLAATGSAGHRAGVVGICVDAGVGIGARVGAGAGAGVVGAEIGARASPFAAAGTASESHSKHASWVGSGVGAAVAGAATGLAATSAATAAAAASRSDAASSAATHGVGPIAAPQLPTPWPLQERLLFGASSDPDDLGEAHGRVSELELLDTCDLSWVDRMLPS